MRFISKITIFSLLFVLVFQSLNLSIYAISTLEQTGLSMEKAIIMLEEDIESIPLSEEGSDSSKILKRLQHKEEVKVLRESDTYTYVEYMNEESGELLRGYVHNDYLADLDDIVKSPPSTETDSEIDDSIDSESEDDEIDDSNDTNSEKEEIDISSKDQESTEDTNVDFEDYLSDNDSNTKEEKQEGEEDSDNLDVKNHNEDNVSNSPNQSLKKSVKKLDTHITQRGIALKSPTSIYQKDSISSEILKSYQQGTILQYKKFSSGWYETRVYVNGKYITGYINVNDVESLDGLQTSLRGIGLVNPIKVYQKASTSAEVLKSYQQGSILQYKTLSSEWYEARVHVNGKYITGYININDVENLKGSQTSLRGIGLKKPTKVYQKASTSAEVLKSYQQGTILQYKTFSSDWYETRVYVNGKYITGYININDVESLDGPQTSLRGVGLMNPTRVYQKPSTSAEVLKSYQKGTILQYKTLSSGWYETRVYVDGKYITGYININDVETGDTTQRLEGFASQEPTHVYTTASTSSKILKSYPKGRALIYKSFVSGWYEATVIINGKATTGYIKENNVINIDPNNQVKLRAIGLKKPTNVYQTTATGSKIIKTYSEGSILQVRTYSNNWFEATVYINNKAQTGYLRAGDLEIINPTQNAINGYAAKNITNVYISASKDSKVLKSYNLNKSIKYKEFSLNWYETGVIINGIKHTGYFHKEDVSTNPIKPKKEEIYINTEYNISLDTALQAQQNALPKASFRDMYVHTNALKLLNGKWNIEGTGWNVRSGPGTNYEIIGLIDQRYINDPITVYSTINNFYRFHTWIISTQNDTRRYLDPAGFQKGTTEYFQFLKLSESTGLNATEVNNKILYDKAIFKGKANAFINASKTHGINEIYLISHAMLETGNGTSGLAQGDFYNGEKVYNMYGVGAADGCSSPYQCGLKHAYEQGWTTPEKAIIGGAKFIADRYINRGQDTLYKMKWNPVAIEKNGYASHQYATDIGWAVKQTSNIKQYYDLLDSYRLVFDVPSYK